jgi:hypothetical protein
LFAFVAKFIFLLSDIMATADFLLKQSTTNNRHWYFKTISKIKRTCDVFFVIEVYLRYL